MNLPAFSGNLIAMRLACGIAFYVPASAKITAQLLRKIVCHGSEQG
jgi:hypothetical protein